MKKLLLFIITAVIPVFAQHSEVHPEYKTYYEEYDVVGSFVLYDMNSQRYYRYNPLRSKGEYIPASTFKIVNSLIALETGVVSDEEEMFEWDGVERSYSVWNQDHNLRSGIKNSVVWMYQEIARRIGEERMQEYLKKIPYGNADISGGIDQFWLRGALRISPEEQVALLRRLYHNELPFSERSMAVVKDIMTLEKTDEYVLRGKTGWGIEPGNNHIGWFVGWLERDGNVYFFANNIEENQDNPAFARARTDIVYSILKELGLYD